MAGLVEENRALWQGPARRMLLFKWALCATLLSGMALCPRLWTSARSFPTVPVFAFLPDFPAWATLGLTLALVIAVLAVAASPRPRPALWAVGISSAALVLFDINRLQPWFCQALLLFLALEGVGNKVRPSVAAGLALRRRFVSSLFANEGTAKGRRRASPAATLGGESIKGRPFVLHALGPCAFVLTTTYFWSGLQKANLAFGANVFPLLLHPFGLDRLQPLWPVAPVLETSVGLLLLFPRTRAWGVAGAFAMHAFLLLVLGPLGGNINSVVWP